MMFELRKCSMLLRRGPAALGLVPFLLALAVGPNPAVAQEWPDVKVYHSTDPGGAAPDAALPPGCEAVAGGGGQTTIIDFEEFSDLELLSDLGDVVLSTITGDGVQVWANGRGGSLAQSGVNTIVPVNGGSATTIGSPVPDLVFTFDNPQNAVGVWGADSSVSGDQIWTMTAYDAQTGGNVISSVSVPPGSVGNPPTFLEVTGPGILRVEISVPTLLSFDDLTFDGSGGLDCVIRGGPGEKLELWIDGGSTPSGVAPEDVCKMPPSGDETGGANGDELCGADILIEVQSGTGQFTDIRPVIGTLVHHPDCADSPGGDGFCSLPFDENEKQPQRIRMNFRRGVGTPTTDQRKIADVRVNSTGSDTENPTTIVVNGRAAASANLQLRPITGGTPKVIATGPVPEPAQIWQLVSGLAGLSCLYRLRRRA